MSGEATLSIRLPAELKEAMAAAAKDEDRSMSQWLIRLVTAHLRKTGRLPK